MRKLIVSMFVSLDGIVSDPHLWTFPYWNDDIAAFKGAELFGVDALVLGRITYEGFAEAWPGRTDEAGYADRINSMPKYVATRTLKTFTWANSHALEGDLSDAINALKSQPGQDLLVFGSAELVQALIERDLVDEYNLILYPRVLGSGIRLFQRDRDVKLTLLESKPTPSGAIILRYAAAHEGPSAAE